MIQQDFFKLAAENGITTSQISTGKSKSFSFSLFNNEIDSYSVNETTTIVAKGIYNDKFGYVSLSEINKSNLQMMIDTIKDSAQYIEKEEDAIIFEGSKKYKKIKTFNKELTQISADVKMATAKKIYDYIKEADPRFTSITVYYDESEALSRMDNSYGLTLKNLSNHFSIYVDAVLKDGEEIVNEGDFYVGNDFNSFDPKEFANKVVKLVLSRLHPTQCKSKNYKVLLNQKTVITLMNALLSHISAKDVQKGTSMFAGKLNEQVVSKKLSVYEKPINNTIFADAFDNEGVATYNKTLIKNGVLQTYIYDLTTAKKDGVESTGNGYGPQSNINPNLSNICIKPGKKSFDDTVSLLSEGVYITEVSGLHAGLNSQSGDFNLQSKGFMIRDGKIAEPLTLVVLSGNIFKMFNDVSVVASDIEKRFANEAPSILIKKLAVSGK